MTHSKGSSLFVFVLYVVVLAVSLCSSSVHAAPSKEDIHRFNIWLRGQCTSPPLIEVGSAEEDGMGLGVVVAANEAPPIRRYTKILEVPLNATFSQERVDMTIYAKALAQVEKDRMIALQIIIEYALGEASAFYPWIRILPTPEEIQPPWMWPDALIKQIEPKRLYNHTWRQQIRARDIPRLVQESVYPLLKPMIARKIAKYRNDTQLPSGGGNFPGDAWTKARFLWALSLVDTRAWNLMGKKYLVPGADFFNHDDDAEDAAFHFANHHANHRSQKFLEFHRMVDVNVPVGRRVKALQVLSDRAGGGAGTALHESYGDNTNDIYFTYHGFLPGKNNRDCIEISPSIGLPRSATSLQSSHILTLLLRHSRLRPNVFDQTVCVHHNENPPLLQIFGWAFALDLPNSGGTFKEETSLMPTAEEQQQVHQCTESGWQRLRGNDNSDYHVYSQRLHVLTRCMNETLKDAPLKFLRLINVSHRIQHEVAHSNARKEFTTIRTDNDTAIIENPDADERLRLIARIRKDRKDIMRNVLAKIRSSHSTYLRAFERQHGNVLSTTDTQLPATLNGQEAVDGRAADL